MTVSSLQPTHLISHHCQHHTLSPRELGGFMGWFIILAFGNFMKDFGYFSHRKWGINKDVHFIGYFCSSGLQLLQVWPSVHLLQTEIPPDSKTMWTPETSLAIKKTNELSRTAAGVSAEEDYLILHENRWVEDYVTCTNRLLSYSWLRLLMGSHIREVSLYYIQNVSFFKRK